MCVFQEPTLDHLVEKRYQAVVEPPHVQGQRLETEDGIYNPGGQLLRAGAGSDAHHVGNELSLNATWQINPHVSATAIYSHFFPGRFIEETGPSKDIDFVELTVQVLF
jgi:Alginate export